MPAGIRSLSAFDSEGSGFVKICNKEWAVLQSQFSCEPLLFCAINDDELLYIPIGKYGGELILKHSA
jgi:hypothetical protein